MTQFAHDHRGSPSPEFRRRRLGALAALVSPGILASGGCAQFNHMLAQRNAPRVLPQTPTTVDVVTVINNNSGLVRSLYSGDASLGAPLTPTLRATLAMERPRHLRLRADTALTGSELDVGSNDQQFWLWAKRQTPPAIFTCRHDQYAQSAARRIFPVEPEWLIEAMGLPIIDPAAQVIGPVPVERGKLRIQAQVAGAFGPMTKTVVVDAARGWVLEQHLHDAAGQLLATSRTSNHFRDPASGATVPRHIEINWPATQFQANIDFRSVQINTLTGAQVAMFELPSIAGSPVIDMAGPGFNLGAPTTGQVQPAVHTRY